MASPSVSSVKKKPLVQMARKRPQSAQIPNASLIYGVAAGALFAVAVYYLFSGIYITGALLFVPSFALFGLSLHFLKGSV